MNQFRTIIGISICLLLLWFLFRGTNWSELRYALGSVDLLWLLLSFALSFASLFARVKRWSYVVRATQPAEFKNIFSATQIAMLVNSVVPARLGDLTRAFVLARLEQIPLTKSLTLVALDRVNDIFALIAVLLIALLAFPSDRNIEFAEGTLGNTEKIILSSSMIESVSLSLAIALVMIISFLVIIYLGRVKIEKNLRSLLMPRFPRLGNWAIILFGNFAEGMQIFSYGYELIKSIAMSLVTWGLVALSLGALLISFNMETTWFAPFVLLAVLGVFTLVTVTPGLVGQYHIAVVAGLFMLTPSMSLDVAKAYAIVAHLVALVPPVVLGVYCMLREDFNFRDLIPLTSKH